MSGNSGNGSGNNSMGGGSGNGTLVILLAVVIAVAFVLFSSSANNNTSSTVANSNIANSVPMTAGGGGGAGGTRNPDRPTYDRIEVHLPDRDKHDTTNASKPVVEQSSEKRSKPDKDPHHPSSRQHRRRPPKTSSALAPSSTSASPTATTEVETPPPPTSTAIDEREFFVEKHRQRMQQLASSIDALKPSSLLLLSATKPIAAQYRHRDNDVYGRLIARVQTLVQPFTVGPAGSHRKPTAIETRPFDNFYLGLFHRWELATDSLDPELMRHAPLKDRTINYWLAVALNGGAAGSGSGGGRQCYSLNIVLNVLANRLFINWLRLESEKERQYPPGSEESMVVELIVSLYQLYSVLLVHEECCAIGAAVTRDDRALDVLRLAFAVAWCAISARLTRMHKRLPPMVIAAALLQRGDPAVLAYLERLLDDANSTMAAGLVYGLQLLLHPLAASTPGFLITGGYERVRDESFVHLHATARLVQAAQASLPGRSHLALDTWYACWPRDTRLTRVQINQQLRPVPYLEIARPTDTVDHADARFSLGRLHMALLTVDERRDLSVPRHQSDLISEVVTRTVDTLVSATDRVHVCQQARLVSVSTEHQGVSVTQRFVREHAGSTTKSVLQELVVNTFATQPKETTKALPTICWNFALRVNREPSTANESLTLLTVANVARLSNVSAHNYKDVHLVSLHGVPADDAAPSKLPFHLDQLDKTHEFNIVELPTGASRRNVHLLRCSNGSASDHLFIKTPSTEVVEKSEEKDGAASNTATSTTRILLRVNRDGLVQLAFLQRMDARSTSVDSSVTVCLNDAMYDSLAKAFDRKLRDKGRSLVPDEAFDYSLLESYTSSMKRNCLSFMYA